MKDQLTELLEAILRDCGWERKPGCWRKGTRRITFKARVIRLDHLTRGRWRRVKSISYNPRIKDLEQFGSVIQGGMP